MRQSFTASSVHLHFFKKLQLIFGVYFVKKSR